MLSGGERALTAIALLFAILSINPSPFSVLDEIEAALDESNVIRFARFLKKYAKNTQFLVITHRKNTMEIADQIYRCYNARKWNFKNSFNFIKKSTKTN